jgi:predicted dehydrogenase
MADTYAFVRTLIPKLCPEVDGWKKHADAKSLKIALIGFGKMGLLHSGILNLLAPGAVKAVSDRSILVAFGTSRLIKSVKFFRNIDKMLWETEPDAVYVTTPPCTHYPIVKNLLDHDVKNIFVEKPPTLNHSQLQDLVSTKKPSQTIMVGFQKKYALTFRHAKLLLENDAIGEIMKVYSYIRSSDILEPTSRFNALGRGALLDLGIHLINLHTWLFKNLRVLKAERKSLYTRVDDTFIAEVEAKDGFRIHVEATWSNPEYRVPETYIEFHGMQGTIKVTEDYLKASINREHPLLGNKREIALYKPHYYQGIPPVNLADPEYTIENLHFLQAIRENQQPLTSIENTSETMKLIDELYKKAKTGNG